MADEEEVLDTSRKGTEGESGEGGADGGETKLIFGKYKSVEEAEKAYKESERKISEQGKTLAERDSRMRDLEEKANLAKTIELLAQRTPEGGSAAAEDYDKYIATLAEEATTNPAEATKKIVALMGRWTADAEQRSTKHAEERLSGMEAKMSALLDKMQQSVETMDPAYQKDKALIDDLVANGMPLPKAKAYVARLNEPDAPLQRPRPPQGAPSGGGKGGGGGGAEPWRLTAREKDGMKTDDGFTDKEIADYELERKSGWEQEQANEKSGRGQQ